MQKHRFLLALISKVLLLTWAMPAFAQTGQWADDLFYIKVSGQAPSFTSVFIDENNRIHKTIPQARESMNFPGTAGYAGPPTWDSFWRDGALYTLEEGASEKNEDGSYFTRWVIAKWTEDDGWCFLGDYKTDDRELLKAIPCDNNRFIVVSLYKDLTGNNRSNNRTPFVRMSLNPDKKELRLDASIDHGQDELRKYMSNSECFGLAWMSEIFITGDHATLINCGTGLYWIFSLKSASVMRTGNIFKKVTPEMIAKGGFSNAILCANPEKAGTILLATQEEDFFIKANDPWRQIAEFRDKFKASPEETDKMLNYYLQENLNRSPFIAWYRIYPETGKVEKLKEYPEGGTWYRDDMKTGTFRPMSDGSVKLNWVSEEWHIIERINHGAEKTDNKGESAELKSIDGTHE